MIATFAIEITLLVYTIVRYKLSTTGRLISVALLLLATFQFAEFHVCEGIGSANVFSRLGFVAIALLPPVGIHLVSQIAGRPNKKLIATAYATGLAFAVIFGLAPNAFDSSVCASNYAIFHLVPELGGLFMVYYYFWLVVGIGLCIYYSRFSKLSRREALILQTIGYLSFILPTGFVNMLNPTTMEGLPSIMCGFAVIYAFTLAFGIAPRVLQTKKSAR